MPIYEYRCCACGHELEALQKFTDAPLVTVPGSARKDTLIKLVSAAGFQLKGSGWYQTDFKGGGTKPPASAGRPRREDAKPARSRRRQAKSGHAPAATPDAKPRAPRRRPRRADAPSAAPGRPTPAAMKRYLDRRPPRLGAARHHDLGAALPGDDARPDAAAVPGEPHPDRLLGFHIPGLRRRADASRSCSLTGVIAANFFGARLIRFWEGTARPHPGRQVDLLVGQAGQRHAAVRFGQRVPQGAARASSRTTAAGRSRS